MQQARIFLDSVRISPIIKAGIYLDESLCFAAELCKMEIDMLHISCWDVFEEVGDGNSRVLPSDLDR